jgi:hypothetical protein
MARLLINPGSPTAREVQLKPGANTIGRGHGNDIQLPHASVSGSHCEIIVGDHSAVLRDLGSTNGTFIQHSQIREAELRTGQTFCLGDVEIAFYSEAPAAPPLPPRLEPLAGLEALPPLAGSGSNIPIGATTSPSTIRATRTTMSVPIAAREPGPAAAPSATEEPLAISGHCKHHPKTPARFFCTRCQQFFCELCIALRPAGGVQHKVCRHCGTECRPVQVRLEPVPEKGFFERVPGAFVYPVRGAGVLIVIVGIVLVGMLRWGQACIAFRTLRLIAFGLILEIIAGGYLFTYFQSIIHSTTAEERELPDLPGIAAGSFFEDVFVPFFRLLGLVVFCFGPAAGLSIWFAISQQLSAGLAALAGLAFGCLYFPMAFLAVAVLDSFPAANPLVVVPSILKVPLEYLLAVFILVSAFVVRWAGNLLVDKLFPEGSTIHSMPGLFAMLASMAFVSFAALYLTIVAVHLLGLIFVTRKEQLGWLNR